MSVTGIDYLSEIGIQRWHLRRAAGQIEASPAEPVSADQPPAEPLLDIQDQTIEPTVKEPPLIELPKAEQTQSSTEKVAAPVDSWSILVEELESATACMACQSSNPILGEGDLAAEWVWIIDAPSSQDISAQTLISGRAGQLFDAILQSINLSREKVYLTSVFKCPPSDDYTAQAGCGDLLRRQLALIKPKRVVAFGEFAAQALLRSNSTLEELRTSVHQPRSLDCNVVTTHSIQDMLLRPELKAQVWQDLCSLYRS